MESSNRKVLIGITVIAILVFGSLVWAIMRAPSNGPYNGNGGGLVTFDDTNAPFLGKADSDVIVRVYSDFQCPACKAAEAGFQYAVKTFGDRVKFVWKDFPLLSTHPNGRPAANAARCAEAQGKFWEYHDILYTEQASWSPLPNPGDSFKAYANRLGLDTGAFDACYDAKTFDGKVMADVSEGRDNRVNATPTFYVNDSQVSTFTPADWDRVLGAAVQTP